MSDKQRQTEKFVGCILSVKTKPGRYGDVQHIIGTVREIDVDSTEQAIVLDQAMSNGAMLPDGYVLLSSQIADLQVMGKANEIQENLKSAYSNSEARKSVDSRVDVLISDTQEATAPHLSGKGVNVGVPNGLDARPLNGNHFVNTLNQALLSGDSGSSTLTNSLSSVGLDYSTRNRNNLSESESGHMIAKPKPRKLESSTGQNTSSPNQKSSTTGSVIGSSINKSPGLMHKFSTNVGLSSAVTADDENILIRTFGNMSTNSNITLNGQALFNAVANSNKPCAVPATNLKQNCAPSPSKLSPQKPLMYDHKKLGALSQFVNATEMSSNPGNNYDDGQTVGGKTPVGSKGANNTQHENKGGKNQGKPGKQRHGETFESMSKDEMSVDFDFEGSNAQFEKLPVTCTRPVKVTKNPQFCTTDTTYMADRIVESIKVKNSVNSTKQFVTDTGIVIPSVDLPTRSKILNLAHEAGLTHSRVVEVMGRAVTQTVLPLLGDPYRLSPERVEDRPWILVCVGPHWQGAIGIAAARILASLGVHTCVYAPKEELQLCAGEEFLYKLSGEMFTRNIGDLKGIHFDMVILAVDDQLTRSLTVAPYARWLKNCPVVFVDPPLISSYRQQIDLVCGGSQKERRMVIVSPVLPVAYPSDSSVKIFLVNLGIPQNIFEKNDVIYKSPFGDKLIVQIFSAGSK